MSLNKIIGRAICFLVEVYLWFKYPTGYSISGHDYVEQDNGELVCSRCGYISK